MRIAVIGSGISGNLAARLLSCAHDVTLFEAGDYAGGHAATVDVMIDHQAFSVDTGFMVFNRKTYPNFCRLLSLLAVESRESEMSFSVRCDKTPLEYQGGTLNGLFAQRSNLVRPRFWSMLRDIVRFNRQSVRDYKTSRFATATLGEYLCERNFSPAFVEQYLLPMISAIWSANREEVNDFPLHFLIGFFRNHGLLQVFDQPTWRTIVGGSRTYVDALLAPLADRIRLNTPVSRVSRHENHVVVEPAGQSAEIFDEVVFATHADQTLRILADATTTEREVLSKFAYQASEAVLHTDARMLPKSRRAWASWNYHIPRGSDAAATVTYDLSRLQGHASPTPILLTLNETDAIDPATILRRFTYDHPSYQLASIAAQRRHGEISGQNRTHFCGAYWGYGFHEDGVNSALAVASHFGLGLETWKAASTKESSRIDAVAR